MSGSTIGGVVGGVIGFFVGGPAGAAWGWQIGSLVGAIVDPDVIEGPRLQESRTQTATDGVALTYGHGTYRCAGNVTWVDEVKEHRHEDDGKGGPVQVTYTYTLSYMVTVCKGPISGYKLIRRNGKIVYDARTDAELTALGYSSQEIAETRAAQSEFLQRATLYYGTGDQMPDPTMVAVLGAGNVPAYTGVAYIVMTDDETREGEYAQFEFVVANCGDRHEGVAEAAWLATGTYSNGFFVASPDGADWSANAYQAPPDPNYFSPGTGGRLYCHGAQVLAIARSTSGGAGIRLALSNGSGAIGTWTGYSYDGDSSSGEAAFFDGRWWIAYGSARKVGYIDGPTITESSFYSSTLASNGTNLYSVDNKQIRVRFPDGSISASSAFTSGMSDLPHVACGGGDVVVTGLIGVPGFMYNVSIHRYAGADTALESIGSPFDDIASSSVEPVIHYSQKFGWVIAYGGQVACGPTINTLEIVPTAPTFSVRGIGDDGVIMLFAGETGTLVSTSDMVEFTSHTVAAGTSQDVVSISGVYGVPIPDAPGYYIDPETGEITGPSGTQIDPCQPTLGEIVASQCDKRGVTSRDVSELTDTVGGYRIAKPSSPLANIQGLQPAYYFGASEFDGKLHFPKRGRDLTFALTYDDMVERDGDLIQWERVQERDLLRKVTVAYTDPATNYADTTQQAERRSATVNAEGESVMELPITGDKDWAAQVADKSIKVAWGEPDECTFHVSIAHAELVTGAEGTVPYTDGTPTVVRIERIDDEGLARMVHARKTRTHLYESNASGAAKPLPRFPGSNVRGPTDGLLMNLPVLLDQDDRPGIHWAASGMLSGWQGGQLQIRRAGQWTVAGTVYGSAGIGTLLDPLPAHAGDVDTANVLRVRFNEPLSSVTWVNLLQERNPFAIIRDDGTAEIIQAQVVTATAPGEYELTTLLRRRLATTTSDHPSGARIVFLDQRVQYATLEATDAGTLLEYRFVSVGTDPDTAPTLTLDLTTMESQREWPVADLAVAKDGDDYTVTWLRRDRLGTDALPIRSANWAGYEVSYSHAGGSDSVVVTTETHTFSLPGATDVTFSVAQLNQFTGAGPAQTVTIP